MPPPKTPLNVLVLAVGGNVSQGILKALATCTFPCRVVGTDLNELQMGLYTVDRGYVAPHARAKEFLSWLTALCEKEDISVVLSGCEPVLRVLAGHRTQVESATRALCFVCDADTWNICDDKLLTCQWLEKHGFAHPAFAASEDRDGIRALLEAHEFPLIAKPRIGGGAHGVFLVHDRDDLEYAARKKQYVLQEFLGSDDEEYTAGCFCDRDGNVAGSIVMWRELLAGTTYRAVAGRYDEVQVEAERITRALKPRGPCNIQLRMTGRGPVCFEINPRFSGTTPIRAALGFNEVEASVRHFLWGETPAPLPVVTQGVALRYWNEIYVSPEACQEARKTGMIEGTPGTAYTIEQYGMK